ncbi:hypothetical protein GO988_05865 [Hymenobacter sp. HMF4947]|uniref:Uncharacterized protein n=1 Tax=Hymenobacter ginkgonis TaxID=2682976 RepID=A0A7K1TBQ6_9BACT|nr:hypothetical protein [Hymenobacter ginkgonis]MVN75847.1 hypothetical protein [Hymenobacter ginkgonis]
MARSATLSRSQRLRQRLAAYRWQRVGWLAGVSLSISLALVLYLFGAEDHFFGRLFSAFFVWFWLLAVTFLAVIPFIGWATTHWFGSGWSGKATPPAKRRAPTPPASTARPAAARRSSTSST